MTNKTWTKTSVDTFGDDYKYKCGCGVRMESFEYNADTGHYECCICGSESPDLDMINAE